MGAMAGCGNTYRPVVAAIGVVGPAAQPTKYAAAISSPTLLPPPPINALTSFPNQQCPTGAQTNGLFTLVDFSGDTTLDTTALGVNPYYFVMNANGTEGFTLNCDHTVNSFAVSTGLIESNVERSTLLSGAIPSNLFSGSGSTFITDTGADAVDELTGEPPALKQELPVTMCTLCIPYTPVYIVGQAGSPRIYAISQGPGGAAGQVSAIEQAINTISATIPVGRGPVYGVMTVDSRRAFILNQTDGTVSVINTQTNALDQFPANPAVPNVLTSTINVGTRPVWADLASGENELVVLNEGNGTTAGSVTLVNIPLCSVVANSSTTGCDVNNPIDASSFGQVVKTIPVGVNPIMVTVLSDYTRAYVANAGTGLLPCSGTTTAGAGTEACTISVVNLTTDTVTATIALNGHPTYIASTDSVPTGKVYVVCWDQQVMTVIETDTDSVDTTIPLQGYGISVRVTAP
jgi:DNA-binding beta-propeller fold protein YncE